MTTLCAFHLIPIIPSWGLLLSLPMASRCGHMVRVVSSLKQQPTRINKSHCLDRLDINLAARNAIDGIINYIMTTYGYNRNQAYIIASVAVDLRISQLVDAPNVGVTALLPLDIFIDN